VLTTAGLPQCQLVVRAGYHARSRSRANGPTPDKAVKSPKQSVVFDCLWPESRFRRPAAVWRPTASDRFQAGQSEAGGPAVDPEPPL